MSTKDQTVLCPRCKTDRFTPYGVKWHHGMPYPPALSRLDNATYICPACGQDEAIRDFTGAAPVPPDEWPVTRGEG